MKFDKLNFNINPQPIPAIYNEGFSQYETLTKILYLINGYLDNMNLQDDEIRELKSQKLSIEDYVYEIKNHRKLDENGNFTGTWNGAHMHESEEGVASDLNEASGDFESLAARLNNSDNSILNLKEYLNTMDIEGGIF